MPTIDERIEHAHEGVFLQRGWEAFERLTIPADAGPVQRYAMQVAFFVGAQYLLMTLIGGLNPATSEATDPDVDLIASMRRELDAYALLMAARAEASQ